ncbi:protein Abitram-like [Salvia divinorum]|uniref:Protein Abitram-like n=1 Tax=Salvia divinorum TaxID=28513 RepID=A0ABD1FR16_SALDI
MTAADDEQRNSHQNLQISKETSEDSEIEQKQPKKEPPQQQEDDEDLRRLLLPNVDELPQVPPSSVEANFTTFFAPDIIKPGHDQYVHRHANGLCVIGKSDWSGIKVTGKRKKNAQHFESSTALCKVFTAECSYIARCCVKGSLLEVNNRLIKQPELLNTMPEREGYVAIMMPRPADWLKAKASLLVFESYQKLRTEQ